MNASLLLPATLLVATALAHAGAADNYQEPIGAYKNDLKSKEPELVNASYYGDRAISQAKRAVDRAGIDRQLGAVESDLASRLLRDGGGDVNVASPQIFGTVRGDVTVVMQRGAVRGSITSVKR
jgi:hypothetical protein